MRLGSNPAKQSPQLRGYSHHRVIIPVYIPHLEGYFEQSLEVLRLCLESLRLSTVGKASVTIISNGSAPQVVEELGTQYEEGWIDQLVLNQSNRGKVDAVVSAMRGSFEELLTVSDADVLFKAGWVEAVEQVFRTFPECGYCGLCPAPNLSGHYTSATLIGSAIKRELMTDKVVLDSDLDRFARSIGNPGLFGPDQRRSQLVVKRNGTVACVGSGHFVGTFHRDVVKAIPNEPSLAAIVGGSEERWLDIPPDGIGFWRLSLAHAYAHHIGNTPEPWVYEEFEGHKLPTHQPVAVTAQAALPPRSRKGFSRLPLALRQLLVRLLRIPRGNHILVRRTSKQMIAVPADSED